MIYCAAREFMIAFVLLWGMMGTGGNHADVNGSLCLHCILQLQGMR
jgi:hypothetical protein